jgi:benzoylsuccinyl-CoA thiolase BbsA subunit
VADQATARPAGCEAAVTLRPGLFEADAAGTLQLVGACCRACGAHFFPRRLVCARCLSSEMTTVALNTRGTLYTYTTVYQSTPEFPTPYLLAYVDLPEGVRLLAHLVGMRPEEVRIDMPLELRVEPVGTEAGGRPVLGYRLHAAHESSPGVRISEVGHV